MPKGLFICNSIGGISKIQSVLHEGLGLYYYTIIYHLFIISPIISDKY
jgi:hypothetical protein